jgi:hypothetical protein
MRDVYLWTGYGLGAVVFAALIKAAVRRLLDWQDRRTATAPPALYTEVWLPPAKDTADPDGLVEWVDPDGVVMWIEPGTEEQQIRPRSWALSALSEVRKQASDGEERLEEFARPVPNAPALIWAELDGIFTARGLVTA